MMNELQKMEQERSVLRWGGLAGLLGFVLLLLAMFIVALGPVGMEELTDLASWPERFPEIITARVLENVVYMVAIVLEIPLFLALYLALRRSNLAPALFGSVLAVVGLIVMVAGATPHVAHAPLSDIYHAADATSADQATIAILWKAIWSIFEAVLYVGFFIVPLSFIVLGAGMLGSPEFGRGNGWLSVLLGVMGLAAAVLQIADPASLIGFVSYLSIIIFCLVFGWKLLRLSRAQ